MRRLDSLRLAITAGVLIAGLTALSATAAEIAPAWVVDFDAPVRWQRVTSQGELIVSTSDGLHGVNPATGSVVWSHADLARLPADGFREIAGAPLFMIDDKSDDRRIMILNALNGTVVFDSRAAGLVEVQGKYVMPRSGGLLIVGFKTGNLNTQLAMHDIATGKQRWHSEVLSEGMNKMTNLLFTIAQVSFDIQAVHAEPVELGDGSILFGAMGAVFRIDAATGEPLWKTEAGNARVLHMTDLIPGRVFVGSEEGDDSSPYYSTFQALDLESGEPAWDKPVRVRGALNPLFISSDRGLIVSERTQGKGRIRLLDHDTGESLWGKKGKGIKVKGGIVDYDFSAAGFVVTTGYDSAWNDKGTEYLLYVVDTRTGALRFKDPLKVKGRMLQTELLEHGLLYVTTHEVNVFSVETGKLLNEHLVARAAFPTRSPQRRTRARFKRENHA
jgi:outer membrane protein assembly factor BamB